MGYSNTIIPSNIEHQYDVGDTVENANSASSSFGTSGYVTSKSTFNKPISLNIPMNGGGYCGAFQTVPALVIDNLRSHDEVDLASKRVVLIEKEIWSEVESRNQKSFSGATGFYTVQGTTVSGITAINEVRYS